MPGKGKARFCLHSIETILQWGPSVMHRLRIEKRQHILLWMTFQPDFIE